MLNDRSSYTSAPGGKPWCLHILPALVIMEMMQCESYSFTPFEKFTISSPTCRNNYVHDCIASRFCCCWAFFFKVGSGAILCEGKFSEEFKVELRSHCARHFGRQSSVTWDASLFLSSSGKSADQENMLWLRHPVKNPVMITKCYKIQKVVNQSKSLLRYRYFCTH